MPTRRGAVAVLILAVGCLGATLPSVAQTPACEPDKVAAKYPSLAGKTIKIGADPTSPPYVTRDPKDFSQLIGFDADLARAVFDCAGVKYEFFLSGWSGLLPAVISGQIDVMRRQSLTENTMLAPIKEIVDLAHELYTGMPNIGDQQIAFWPIESFEALRTISQGKLASESRMMLMAEHCGTRLDAPRHFDEAGLSVAQVPLEQLILPGHLLDLTHRRNGEAITISDFEAAEAKSGRVIGGGTAVVCWTGCDKEWGTPGWVKNRPFVPTDSAQWLVDRGIALFATDLIGMDDPAEWWWPTHAIWLRNGVCMVQQLCRLDRLVGKEFLFVCLPLKMRDGTGCPVRPVALVM